MQYLVFGAYRVSSREMWRDLRENEITVSKSLDDFTESKPRTRISLSNDVLAEFEKIRREIIIKIKIVHLSFENDFI